MALKACRIPGNIDAQGFRCYEGFGKQYLEDEKVAKVWIKQIDRGIHSNGVIPPNCQKVI